MSMTEQRVLEGTADEDDGSAVARVWDSNADSWTTQQLLGLFPDLILEMALQSVTIGLRIMFWGLLSPYTVGRGKQVELSSFVFHFCV